MPVLKDDKREQFCNEYIKHYNATEAYIKSWKTDNRPSARVLACHIMKEDAVKARIIELKKELREAVHLENVDIVLRLQRYLDADLTEFMELTPEEIKQLPAELRGMITKFRTSEKKTVTEFGENVHKIIELEFFDKKAALEMLNKHLGFYEADNKQKIDDKPAIIVPDQETAEKYNELIKRLS